MEASRVEALVPLTRPRLVAVLPKDGATGTITSVRLCADPAAALFYG